LGHTLRLRVALLPRIARALRRALVPPLLLRFALP